MNGSEAFYNIIGFVGSALLLFGFYRTSIGKWAGKSFWYELDNLVGATLIVIYQIHHQAYITMVLNVIWGIVAFRGVTSFAQRYQASKKQQNR